MIENSTGHCVNCGAQRRFIRTSADQAPATAALIAITLCTCGLGFPVACVVAWALTPPPRCIVCGAPRAAAPNP
jgi:uncharacterized protein (DUF2336 family)